MAPALLLALVAAAAEPPDSSAEARASAAIAAQRSALLDGLRLDCPPAPPGENEVLVCARSRERYRLRPIPGDIARAAPSGLPADRAGGEQMDALANADPGRCSTIGRAQSCGGVDLLGAGLMLIREVVAGIRRRQD